RPPSPTLFPYTTLFRSKNAANRPLIHFLDGLDLRGARRLARPRRRDAQHQRGRDVALRFAGVGVDEGFVAETVHGAAVERIETRSEEHTSELQSRGHLV